MNPRERETNPNITTIRKQVCMRVLRNTFSVIALLLLTLQTASAQLVLRDRVAAIVDDDVVMLSEVEERLTNLYERLEASGTELPPPEALRPRVLDQLILERIQLNQGLRAGIRISEAELNQTIVQLASSQGMSVEELIERAHERGMTLASLRRQFRNDMIIARVQEAQVGRRIRITESEVDNFLNSPTGQYWSSPDLNLGHILIPLSLAADPDEVAAAEGKVSGILGRLESGADFRKIAVTESADQNALNGGDLGWRKATELPPSFVVAVEGLENGQVSRPIRSDAGIHLLKLYDKRGAEKQLIQQHKVRHILVKPNEIRSDEDARTMAAGIRADILAGADFAELAKEQSEDIGSALSGGELGWSLPGQFVPQFEEIMAKIELGAVSEPFRSQFGWHILQVTERRNQDFSDNIKKRQAQQILFDRKFQEELPLWLQQIREEAFVNVKI
ncbi:MAG: peptidylprolyl isomerase [bacterium]